MATDDKTVYKQTELKRRTQNTCYKTWFYSMRKQFWNLLSERFSETRGSNRPSFVGMHRRIMTPSDDLPPPRAKAQSGRCLKCNNLLETKFT